MSAPTPGDRLATLARVAGLREDRAMRAWRAATAEREARAAVQADADDAHRTAQERAHNARAAAMADPCSEQAWVWTAARRSAREEAHTVSVEADAALDEAAAAALRSREAFNRTQMRGTAIGARVSRERRAERRRDENRQAEDVPAGPVRTPRA